MTNKLTKVTLFLVILSSIFFIGKINLTQASSGLNFNLHAVTLDGIDPSFIQSAMTEATNFINNHSNLRTTFTISSSTLPHTYSYSYPPNCGVPVCVDVSIDNLDPALLSSLPPKDMYIFFYNTNGQPPLNAGSTYDISLKVGGVYHPYSSIPSDTWWFIDYPFEGFHSRKAQIITHEINNQLNEMLRLYPYFCPEMTATDGLPGYQYEAERLSKLDDGCYQNIFGNHHLGIYRIIPH